ncbi:MAG: type II toxin-antitoxin system VapC family toxin [Actinobacteria bacterium]|nr:type II toxin-antitoxin system VapC family toxin [Actinomycetota bacterium]
MIFIDTNIIMYAAGKEHKYKNPCLNILKRISDGEIDAVSDSEVLQEILYRYWSIRKLDKGFQVFSDFDKLIPIILRVDRKDLLLARDFLEKYPKIKPRDAIHAAVMLNNKIDTTISTDNDFKQIKEIKRIDPLQI